MCTCMHMCAFPLSVVFQIHGLAIRSLDSLAMFADFMQYKHLDDDDDDKNQLYWQADRWNNLSFKQILMYTNL